MVTYLIIEELTKLNIHIKLNGINVATLFFADDGILLSSDKNSARIALNKLEEVGKVCGLEINKEKSSHLINMNKDSIEEIGNIRVGSQIKYLGIEINEGRNCFKEHKRQKLTKAKEMANMIMTVIARSTNKILIGKTYWKNVALAEIMYGAEIITYNKNEIEQLQKTENQAYRKMLGAPRYTPSCTLRGEIGSSEMASRDKTTKLNFMKHILSSGNDMLREIAEMDFQNKLTKFTKTTQKYMNEINISKNSLLNKTNTQIKEIIKQVDSARWTEEKNNKTTLEIYNRFKTNIKEENHLYDNSEDSIILFRARTNTLPLNWRNIYKPNPIENEQICPVCKREIETLEHFLLKCEETMNIRQRHQIWEHENHNERLENILCFGKSVDGKKLLKELWSERKKKIPENDTPTN